MRARPSPPSPLPPPLGLRPFPLPGRGAPPPSPREEKEGSRRPEWLAKLGAVPPALRRDRDAPGKTIDTALRRPSLQESLGVERGGQVASAPRCRRPSTRYKDPTLTAPG